MNTNNIPPNSELPSGAKLIKSTLIAIVSAAVILIIAVLPAEYGIDPTGIGKALGLTKMGEIKVSLTKEASAERTISNQNNPQQQVVVEPPEETVAAASAPEKSVRTDEMTFSLAPNEGYEIKVTMKKGKQITYTWWTNSGRANFDVHGDSVKLKIKYHNYYKGSTERKEGMIEAAFDGKHGWFWRNRTSKKMTITLQVKGDYTDFIKDV